MNYFETGGRGCCNWKSKKNTVEKEPTDKIEHFCSGIWSKPTVYNKDA